MEWILIIYFTTPDSSYNRVEKVTTATSMVVKKAEDCDTITKNLKLSLKPSYLKRNNVYSTCTKVVANGI